jgi:hypothetical protein
MRKPFAITLDVGSSRANHTGAWRTERPVYVHNLPSCNNACSAGENIQQWLYDAEEGAAKYEAAWRQIMQDNPFPAVMGRVATGHARPPASAPSWTRSWASTRWSGSSATRRSARAGKFPSMRRRRVSGCWW